MLVCFLLGCAIVLMLMGRKMLRDSWVYSEVSSFLKVGVCDIDFGQRQGVVRCLKIFRSVLVY